MGFGVARSSVRRAALLRQLHAISGDTPLILLAAPAGYGKTTLLRQWAEEDHRRLGWIQLRESDNDPARLLRRVADVLGPAGSDRWLLILDDAHLLHREQGLGLLSRLAADVPAGCTLAIAGRSLAGLDLGGTAAGVRHAELGPAELSLTTGEVGTLVAGLGVTISRAAVAVLRERTEGWPAGTYLAALAIAAAADGEAAASSVGGDDVFITDYFLDEVMRDEPAELVRFLLRTAPLGEMTASLCDFVTGQSGSAVWLTGLERRHLFLSGPVGDRRWYRYHPLLAETLRSELRRREPGEEERVHRRAALWYEAYGRPEEAVRHAFAGRDPVAAARLIGRHLGRFVDEGRIEVAQRWLAELGMAALERMPLLAIRAGWVWALGGDAVRALQCLAAAENGARAAGVSAWGARLTAGAATLRAALAPLGVEVMVHDARYAAAQFLPPAEQGRTAALLGMALLLTGDAEAGAAQLERAVDAGGHREARFALAQLSLLAADAGDWPAAAGYAGRAGALVEPNRSADDVTSIPAHVARAAVAVHDGDPRAARGSVDRALRLCDGPALTAFPWLGAQLATSLGGILLDLGDHAAATARAAEARRFLARLPAGGVLRGRYQLLAAGLAGHDGPAATILTAAELRILGLLPTNLTLGQIADRLFVTRNTVKSQVAAVYRKLNATTRTQAVHEGRTLGLITS
ncbi:LuxR C-terminal-related transcriptional regulator [Actinoplanes sp. CA-030573]|uniref:LuxR C-terminal-related transcriptional regulator n=1 Tax=Actinoplanes sp. CA-030573 TaxID=3239898 RepID=UPI003D92E461